MGRIYLDYNASTPIDPAVAAAMRPFLEKDFGNPSSGHWASTSAKAALECARAQVSALLGSAPEEIVFTSGGSEANDLAIKGSFFALRDKGVHIITTAVEHPAVLAPCRFLEQLGATVTYLPVDSTGRVDPEHRLPNTLNVSFVGLAGADVLAQLDGVAASNGSACHAGRVELSPVLHAMGIPDNVGMGAVRFSLGRYTTGAEIDAVIAQLAQTFSLSAGST